MLKQSLNQKLLQKLSPQQIQFIKLLELTTLNFEEKVEEELMENPALESGKDEGDLSNDSDDSFDYDDGGDDYDSYDKNDDAFDSDLDVSDYLGDDDGGIRLNDQYSGSDEEKEFIPINSTVSFRENLKDQLASALNSDQEEIIADQIIGTLDDDGYLRRPLRSIVNDLLFSSNVRTSEEELESVLKKIHQLDPPGVGARSLQECLLLQIRRKAKTKNTPITKLAELIIEKYMEDFSKKHYARLIKKLDVNEQYLKEAITFIAKLNPKPAGSANDNVKTDYIIPDFVVKEVYGELEVSLNNRNTPELRVSPSYRETLKGYEQAKNPDKSVKDAVQFIKQKLDSAKWFVDSVKQRQNTLLMTMQAIVNFQKEYFLSGDETTLRPMILKDIADRIHMDVSTISRVASSKYVETDFGIFRLKHFFSEGIVTESGEEVSNKEVKKILSDAIDGEDKRKPLTDGKLMDILKEKGYNIARRTVAKYREQMQIPVARLRKELQ
ncbi:MAG: RNA polymerase factor sigma-54 [Flavobacteriales bacterium]|nr:RNA polymerase factor sigma-54 [Bacteroidota bacterium]MCB9241536.1 RNA polymerase factor sigma-54 [Flavobacteriales bacterium]